MATQKKANRPRKRVEGVTGAAATADRSGTDTSAAAADATPPMSAPETGVRIRMYRQGLGDCFLLAFPPPAGKSRPFYMLIDCGVIPGTERAADKMRAVAANIRAATRDKANPAGRLDLLVVTHEHADHLSGFVQANNEFQKLTIDKLWLAWTEDPADKLANDLRSQRKKARDALRLALNRFQLAADKSLANRVAGVLSFFGDENGSLVAGGGGPEALSKKPDDLRTIEDALRWVREKAATTEFLRPGGAPHTAEGLEGVKFYVLGPPHDEATLRHSDASTAEKKRDVVYQLGASLAMDMAFFSAMFDGCGGGSAAAAAQGELDLETPDLTRPFDDAYRIDPAAVGITSDLRNNATQAPAPRAPQQQTDPEVVAFFQDRYAGDARQRPEEDPAWRRIDGDWMEAGAQLALKLDSDTNNTSLALAIELNGGRVLLFPADAQVGNWTSWQSYKWRESGDTKEVTVKDLLARTVFYKVGHHGSHNATLRVGGLEWMGNDLVAMMPVDEQVAHEVKKWIHMPLPTLVAALTEKTGGRLLRIDKDLPKGDQLHATLTQARRKQFEDATSTSTALYHEIVIGSG